MGNEASLEGEGEGLPEGLAAATGGGAGGAGSSLHPALPAGMEADLSQLSEDERRQIAAVMSRAQGLPKGSVAPAAAEPPSMHRHAQHASLCPGTIWHRFSLHIRALAVWARTAVHIWPFHVFNLMFPLVRWRATEHHASSG